MPGTESASLLRAETTFALAPKLVTASGLTTLAYDAASPSGALLELDDAVSLGGIRVTDSGGTYDATGDPTYQAQAVFVRCRVGTAALIAHEDEGVTAAYRIRVAGLGMDLDVDAEMLVMLVYAPTESRWVAYDTRGLTGSTGATGATGPAGPQGDPGPDSYTPGTASHWAGTPPTTFTEAMDRMAAYANQASLLALLGVNKP